MEFAALEPSRAPTSKFDFDFDAGPEPAWVRFTTTLPKRILSHLPELHETADPSFVLTEHGNAECFELAYSDGTRFVVDGSEKRVWGTFRSPLTAEDLATYFLEPVFGFLLRMRHITSLHASCVEISDHAIALCGEAGSGKSTTAAALALRGFPVLSEDIVPLSMASGAFRVVPGIHVSVCGPIPLLLYLGRRRLFRSSRPSGRNAFSRLTEPAPTFPAKK